jgi:hypothetical protein
MTCLLIKFPNDLTVNTTNHIWFSIYRTLSSNRQQRQEAEDIWWFLLSLCKLMPLEDVKRGSDPPDFVFQVSGKSIGVELTNAPEDFLLWSGSLRSVKRRISSGEIERGELDTI